MNNNQDKNAPDNQAVNKQMLDQATEVQLAAFVDGEAGWWQSFFIRKKLCSCFNSRQYVDRLERSSQCFRMQYVSETEKECAGLAVADKVISRIAQEERLSLLRSLPSDYLKEQGFFARFLSPDRLAWGSFGAAFASLIFLFVIPSFSELQNAPQSVNGQQLVALNSNSISAEDMRDLQLAAVENEYVRPVFFSQFAEQQGFDPYLSSQRRAAVNREGSFYLKRKNIAPQIVDVDWVRSAGRVKVLRDPNGKASILWVQKKQPAVSSFGQRNLPKDSAQPEVEFVSNK